MAALTHAASSHPGLSWLKLRKTCQNLSEGLSISGRLMLLQSIQSPFADMIDVETPGESW